jgi:talin
VQDILLGLAKAVANATAALVLKAKNVAATSSDETQNRIIAAATQCALATSQLVACAKVYHISNITSILLFILYFSIRT